MKGKIYRLYNSETCYIGSTIQNLLSKRKAHHKEQFNKWINGNYHWVSSFNLYMNDEEVKIELLEEREFDTKKDLLKLEAEYIDKYDCVNQIIPTGDSLKEKSKKEYQKSKNKDWYKQSKAKYKEKWNEMVQCECGAMVQKKSLIRHKKRKTHLLNGDLGLLSPP